MRANAEKLELRHVRTGVRGMKGTGHKFKKKNDRYILGREKKDKERPAREGKRARERWKGWEISPS